MSVMKKILLYVWQFPQNLLGVLLFWWYRRNSKIFRGTFRDIRVLYSDRMRGGLSLGEYVILPFSAGWLPECSWSKDVNNLHRHEWGTRGSPASLAGCTCRSSVSSRLRTPSFTGLTVAARSIIISGRNAGRTASAVSSEIKTSFKHNLNSI